MGKIRQFLKKFKQPTSVLGLGSLLIGIGQLFDANYLEAIGQLLSNGTAELTADPVQAVTYILIGLAGVFIDEKDKRIPHQ